MKHLEGGAAYHIARKQIPCKGGAKVAGLKLEMFIFDPFTRAERTTLFEVRSARMCSLCALQSVHSPASGIRGRALGVTGGVRGPLTAATRFP